jgi:hypothetical protein
MNALLLPLSILCGLILCATAISLFAVHRAYCLLREMDARGRDRQSQGDAGLQSLRDTWTRWPPSSTICRITRRWRRRPDSPSPDST